MDTRETIEPEFVQRLARIWYGTSLPDRLAKTYAKVLAANRRACAKAAPVDFDAAPANFDVTVDRLAEGG